MDNGFEKQAEEAAAFQKIWMESMSKVMQAAFTYTPNSPPPEILRQMRSGIFQALAESWEQFMRSPQFLEGMRQWMENAIAFRRLSNEFMGRIRNETQGPSRADMDTIMLTVRHMEKRLLDRVEEMSAEVRELKESLSESPRKPASLRGNKARRTNPKRNPASAVANGQTKAS
jgi:hypothetical protein